VYFTDDAAEDFSLMGLAAFLLIQSCRVFLRIHSTSKGAAFKPHMMSYAKGNSKSTCNIILSKIRSGCM